VPFFLIHEGYDRRTPDGLVHKTWTMDDDGNVPLPEGPGLGVEVDEAVLLRLSENADRTFAWPDNRHDDGSVADY
ncbi:hypothetical protein HN937_26405, partial [Candidatus Poribacteria bacterium]|nr:hypothetical protein [Candidatus Poribacteria bacterium]